MVRRRVRLMRLTVLAALVLVAAVVTDLLDRPPASVPVRNPGPAVTLPAPPRPWSGESTGCTVPDPTGTEGCVTAATAWLVGEVDTAFGDVPVTCWSEHAWNPRSDHPAGRGCDLFFGSAGERAAAADLLEGWRAAQWLRRHAEALEVRYLIWQGRIWRADRADQGWARYDGGGVYDPSDATGGHYDHVHVSVRR